MNPFPLALSGALSEASATIIEKRILKDKKLSFKVYTTWGFLAIVIVLLIVMFFTEIVLDKREIFSISPQAFMLKNVFILGLVILLSILANLFVFYAMKWEKITALEPMRLMQPLFAIALALLLYAPERHTQTSILLASIIAAITLVISHIKRHHLSFNKYSISAILGSLFFALELVISRTILNYYSPMSFYLIRCAAIFVICFMIFKPKINQMSKRIWQLSFVTSIIWVFYRFLLYSSYVSSGIIFTTLIFILAPIFIFLFAGIFLKEKITARNLVAAIIITACVSYAIFSGQA